jgi:hypothetical protein
MLVSLQYHRNMSSPVSPDTIPAPPSYTLGGHQPRPTRFNRLAVVSACLWPVLLLGSIGSIVTGHIALRQIRRTHERGRALALVGLVLGYVSLASSIIFVVVFSAIIVANVVHAASSAVAKADNSGQTAASTGLIIGDCFDDNSIDGSSDSVDKIDCSALHDDETYASATLPTVANYPGDSALGKTADALCEPLFVAFTGTALNATNLDYSNVYPSASSWKAGDRAVLCYVFQDDKQVKGSVKSAGTDYPLQTR